MTPAYPGEIARRRCADRTRAELISYQPKRPLALRDELRIRGMQARCATCRACPTMVMVLGVLAPPPADEAAPAAAIQLRLAS